MFFFFSSRRRHTRSTRDWSSDVCSSDLVSIPQLGTVTANHHPVVVLTSNAQRKLTEALRGRCFLLWMDYPRSEERRVGKECRSRGGPTVEEQEAMRYRQR